MNTCTFGPEVYRVDISEDGLESIDTNEPADECVAFLCSNCKHPMMYGGDGSWFETEPPYTPRFDYCPYCGSKVKK